MKNAAVGGGVDVGVGVGVADAFTTVTVPTILQQEPWGVQKYGNDPTLLKVCVNMAPWLRIPDSQSPLGEPGVPEVLLWPLELQVHRTVSPGLMVTSEGEKQKPQLGPTITVTVAAPVTVG